MYMDRLAKLMPKHGRPSNYKDQTDNYDSRPEVIKIFMLNSAEHEILNARKFKIEIQPFSGSNKPGCCFFFLYIKV